MKLRIITALDGVSTLEKSAADVSLPFLQGLVGGLIESVLVPDTVRDVCAVFVNEEGLLLGLPVNRRGTGMVHDLWKGDPDAEEVVPWLTLCGTVVIVTGTPDEIATL